VCQNGVSFLQNEELVNSHKRREEHFKNSSYYLAPIPSYIGGSMAFGIASDKEGFNRFDEEVLEERMSTLEAPLRYYNPSVHVAAFSLPNYILNDLE